MPPGPHPAIGYRPPRHLVMAHMGLMAMVGGALLTMIWVALWFGMATNMRNNVAAWFEMRRAEGFIASHAGIEMSGFPFIVRAGLKSPVIASPPGPDAWRWEGEQAKIEGRPWDWKGLHIHSPGRHVMTLPTGGGHSTFEGTAKDISLEAVIRDGFPWQAELTLEGLDFQAAITGDVLAVASARIKAERTFTDNPDEPSFKAAAESRNLRLPAGMLNSPLGNTVSRFSGEAELKGPFPQAITRPHLESWRDAGGTLEILRLEASHGPVDFSLTGTMALDGDMQPVGAFTSSIEGFFEAIDAMEQQGWVRGRDAIAAKLVLGALAKRPTGGGRPSLSIPLSLQDRKLHAGPVPLMAIGRIEWRQGMVMRERETGS